MRSIKQRIICAICAIIFVLTVCPVLPTQAEGLTTEVTVPFRSDVGFSLPDGNTTTSSIYRIPAMITLHDGTIVAAADIRWNTTDYYDGGGLDTLTARSKDGGANWNYTLANYFGDNGNVYDGANSTCFIDPCLVTNSSGDTVYMLVDLYPYGVALNGHGFTSPTTETGFDGDNKLQLRYNGNSNYECYLNLEDYYIYRYNGNKRTDIKVDDHFNYTEENQTHNLFFKNSPYQVARTAFLYLTKSTNGGKTWSAPKLLNLKNGTEMACLVGPGRGVTTSDGKMIIPIYSYSGGNQAMGFLYSSDGDNWTRVDSNMNIWSSESAVVALKNGNLRFFFRNGTKTLRYVDYSFGTGWGNVQDTGIYTNSNTQISAITYSKTDADGNQVILVSCPAGSNAYGSDSSKVNDRTNGRIFVFTDNGTAMTCVNTIEVNNGYFMYSCLTERADGSVAILYEAAENYAMDMKVYTEAQLLPSSGGNEGGDDEGGDAPDTPTTQSITLWVGQTKQAETVLSGQLGTEGDHTTEDGVAQYNISHNSSVTHQDSTAKLGTTSSFNGETVNLHQALYTFTGDNTNGFTVYNEGSSVYLNNIRSDNSTIGYPGSSKNEETYVFHKSAFTAYGSNAFNIKKSNEERYLYFHRSTEKMYRFDKQGSAAAQTAFLIYAPVDGNHTSSSELPGYYQITSEEQILSGGKYLIVAKGGDGLYYVLYPSTSTSNYYAHVAKATGTAVTCTIQTEGTVITFTGLVPGETTVEIGSTVYTVTVKAQEKSVTEQMQPNTTLNLDPISDLDLNGSDYTVTYQINSGSAVTVDNTGKVTSGSTTGSAVIEATVMRGTVHCGTVTYTVDVSEVIVEETLDYFLPVGGKAIVSGLDGELFTSMLDTGIATVTPGTTSSITINGVSEGDTSVVVGTTQINIHVVPKNTDSQYDNSRNKIDIEIVAMENCDVYYSINGSELHKIQDTGLLIQQDFYGGFNIMFYAAPHPGHALTFMNAPGSNGDYYTLPYEGVISNSEAWPQYADGTIKYHNNREHGFAKPLYEHNVTEERLKTVFDEAISMGCHGAQTFLRNNSNIDLTAELSFLAEKLPEFSKEIVGYKRGSAQSTEDEANGYLNISGYTDYFVYKNGVELAFGDTLLYKFTVNSTSTNVNYTNITVQDTKIGYTKTINDNQLVTPGTHSYYTPYTIKPEDVGMYAEGRFVNDAQLSYTYSSAYSSGTYGGSASAEATCDIVGLVSYAWLEGTPEAIIKNTGGQYPLPASFNCNMYTNFYISSYTGETTYTEKVDGIDVTWAYTGQWGVREFGMENMTWFRVETALNQPFQMKHSRSLTFYGRWLPSYSVVYTWEGEHPNVELPSTVAHPQGESYTVDNTIPVGYTHNDGTYTWIFQGWKRDGDTALNGTSQTIGAGHDYYTGSWTKSINSSSLTIQKVIDGDSYGEGEKFLFHIEGSNVDLTVAIAAGEHVTIYGLTVGETYTVTELTDWSWRYEATAVSQQKELSADATGNVLTFTNKLAVDRWLSGDHFNENQFSLNN